MARHGGGCFSGKDATKVDRSGAYMCRYIAKNFVAAGLTDRCEVGVYYAIGVARPLSIFIDTFGTSKVSDDHMVEIINKYFDLRPRAIISKFDLCRPMYRQLATYGHFGREDLSLPWEELDMVDILKEEL
jgi:S-adenosylmethionine synthetase